MVFVGLFAAGLLFADVLASSVYPSFGAGDVEIVSYFRDSTLQVRALSLLHSLAAVALVIFAVHISSVIRRADETAERLGALALVSGAMAATFLLLSAVLFWAMALPVATTNPDLLRVVLALSYLAGGLPAFMLPLAVFVGASTVGLRARLIPKWLARLEKCSVSQGRCRASSCSTA